MNGMVTEIGPKKKAAGVTSGPRDQGAIAADLGVQDSISR
jgi:hypothetical protein